MPALTVFMAPSFGFAQFVRVDADSVLQLTRTATWRSWIALWQQPPSPGAAVKQMSHGLSRCAASVHHISFRHA